MWTSSDGQYQNQIIFFAAKEGETLYSQQRPGTDCGSDHELLIAKFRLKLRKVGSQEIPGVTGKSGFRVQNEAGPRITEFCQENALVIATLFQQHRRRLYSWTSPDGQHQN